MERIVTRAHSDDALDYGATLRVELDDGSSLSETLDVPLGRGPESPLPESMLSAKFQDCARRVLAPERAERIYSLLRNLEAVPDIRSLTKWAIPEEESVAERRATRSH